MTALQDFLATPNGRLAATAALALGVLLGPQDARADAPGHLFRNVDGMRGGYDPASDRHDRLSEEYLGLVELRDELLEGEASCAATLETLSVAAAMMGEIADDESVPARRRLLNMAGLAQSTIAELLADDDAAATPDGGPAAPSGPGPDPFAEPRFREAAFDDPSALPGLVRPEADVREVPDWAALNAEALRRLDEITVEVGEVADRSRACGGRVAAALGAFAEVIDAAGPGRTGDVSRAFLDRLAGAAGAALGR